MKVHLSCEAQAYTQSLPTTSHPRFHANRYFHFAYASLHDNALSLSAKSRKCFSALCASTKHTHASSNACLGSRIPEADFLYELAATSSNDTAGHNNVVVLAARYAEIATLFYLDKASRAMDDHRHTDIDTPGNPDPSHTNPDGESFSDQRPTFIRKMIRGKDEKIWLSNCLPENSNRMALDETRRMRWKLACEAIERYPALKNRLAPQEINAAESRYRVALSLYPDMPEKVKAKFKQKIREEGVNGTSAAEGMVFTPEELVIDHPRNWPGDDLLRQIQGSMMGMVMWGASTVYGAVHLAGWKDSFPTPAEMWFWRTSAAYLVFSGLLWAFINLLDFLSGSVWLYWYEILAGDRRGRSHILILGLCVLGGVLYVVARIYLVVEAFISLRALPAAAYVSPAWILTVPHL